MYTAFFSTFEEIFEPIDLNSPESYVKPQYLKKTVVIHGTKATLRSRGTATVQFELFVLFKISLVTLSN